MAQKQQTDRDRATALSTQQQSDNDYMQRLRSQNQSIDSRIQSSQATEREKQPSAPQPQDYQSYTNLRTLSKGVLEGRASSQQAQQEPSQINPADQAL